MTDINPYYLAALMVVLAAFFYYTGRLAGLQAGLRKGVVLGRSQGLKTFVKVSRAREQELAANVAVHEGMVALFD